MEYYIGTETITDFINRVVKELNKYKDHDFPTILSHLELGFDIETKSKFLVCRDCGASLIIDQDHVIFGSGVDFDCETFKNQKKNTTNPEDTTNAELKHEVEMLKTELDNLKHIVSNLYERLKQVDERSSYTGNE